MKLSRINIYLIGIDILITEESERTIDFISLPYVDEERRERILDYYCRRSKEEKTEYQLFYESNKKVSLKLMAAVYGMSA